MTETRSRLNRDVVRRSISGGACGQPNAEDGEVVLPCLVEPTSTATICGLILRRAPLRRLRSDRGGDFDSAGERRPRPRESAARSKPCWTCRQSTIWTSW